MKQYQIDSFDAVKDFLFEMYYTSDHAFDPADDISSLRNKNGSPLFTETQSAYFNKVMLECFVFCILNDLNIYTLAAMVKYDIYQNNAAA